MKEFTGELRKDMIRVPEAIYQARGILVFGKRIRSLVFTTDVSIIRNINADAVIAVYPFTPQPVITHSLLMAADKPVFSGVGGGTTMGQRVVDLARDAEFQGAMGVVVNAPTPNETVKLLDELLDIPVVVTVVSENDDLTGRIQAGCDIFNVSGADKTAKIVRHVRKMYPEVPIIATGGPTEESILETIDAGADAITYTPPTSAELFRKKMVKYRKQIEGK